MKKKLSLVGLVTALLLSLTAFFTVNVFASEVTTLGAFENALTGTDVFDTNVEELNFDDLYHSSCRVFNAENSAESMFGGFIRTNRIVSSYEISYDVTVLEAPTADSVLGFGVKNVESDAKQNLIKSGGYEILFGKNARLEDVATTSLNTISIIKNGALTDNATSTANKYAVATLPSWVTFEEGQAFNLKIGAINITDAEGDNVLGYKIYVKLADGTNTDTVIEVIDYCNIEENIGRVATGVIIGDGEYEITTKDSDNVTTLEQAKVYDILELDQNKSAYYSNTNASSAMFGCSPVLKDLSFEISMRVIVETPTNGTWNTFTIGLRNVDALGGKYASGNCGYSFNIGNGTPNGDTTIATNNNHSIYINRNGLYQNQKWSVNASTVARMPEWLFETINTKGASYKLTVGLRRIMDGETALGYYAYLKANDQIMLDFYDYFDWEANIDYFGEVLTGCVNNAGAYTVTTAGETDRRFETVESYDLSELVPVTADGLTYQAVKELNSVENVIGRYLTGVGSVAVSYKFKYEGTPILDLSVGGLDDWTTANSVRYRLDTENNTFRVYSVLEKTPSFDTGDLDLSEVGVTLTEGEEYLIEYGVRRYGYGEGQSFDRAQVFLSINGRSVYVYNSDYTLTKTLGYYVGGRIIGDQTESVTIIPLEQNQVNVALTASLLKPNCFVGERTAIVYTSTTPFGVITEEYVIVSGEDIVKINNYGAITGLKAGKAIVKVKVTSQYGVYESNEIEVEVLAKAQTVNKLEYKDNTTLWIIIGGSVGAIAVACAVVFIVLNKKKKN